MYLAANNIEHVLKCVECLPEDLCLNTHRKGSVTATATTTSTDTAGDDQSIADVIQACLSAMDENIFDLLRVVVNEVSERLRTVQDIIRVPSFYQNASVPTWRRKMKNCAQYLVNLVFIISSTVIW